MDPDVPRPRILDALHGVERLHGVRILLAIESGSRAWGFPSADRDLDVRFIYARPRDDYLRVTLPRDVVELPLQPLPAPPLDMGGWDVRKALGLVARSNAVALEWLRSPITYRRDDAAAALLTDLAGRCAHLPALRYHYDRLARAALGAGTGPLRLKSLFYALRPALALQWMRRHGTPPPMDLPALLPGTDPAAAAAITDARDQKAAGTEADAAPCPPVLEAFLHAALQDQAPRPAPWDQAPALAAADRVFRTLLDPPAP